MKKMTQFGLLLLTIFIIGCSIPIEMGRPLAMADLHAIEKGMTAVDVKNRLGEPMTVGRDSDGNQTWSWYHLHAILPAKADTAPEMQRLTITLTSNDRVLSVAYDLSNPTD